MLVLLAAATDTVALGTLARAPAFDGVVGAAEYGAPIASMPTSGGPVSVWMGRSGEWVYVAAVLPDSTPAWRDEFALLLDPIGDRTPAPGHDDSEWVIRRVVDSSEVLRGVHGSWQLPGNDPAWRLGAARGAVFAALVPTFSLLIAIPLLHELPTPLQITGVLFVTAGMVLALGLHDPARWRMQPASSVAPR